MTCSAERAAMESYMERWTDLEWLCIDTETTGVDANVDRIVELGAVRFARGQPVRRMGMLVNPGMPIPPEASAIHGIADADVARCPTLPEIADRFLGHVREAGVLVGYNWPFDAGMLEAGLGDRWREAIADKPVLDALVVVRLDSVGRYWKGPGRHRLDAAAERLGVAREGRGHRASSDCILTCRILWQLRGELPEAVDEAAAFVARERVRQDEAFAAWSARRERTA